MTKNKHKIDYHNKIKPQNLLGQRRQPAHEQKVQDSGSHDANHGRDRAAASPVAAPQFDPKRKTPPIVGTET